MGEKKGPDTELIMGHTYVIKPLQTSLRFWLLETSVWREHGTSNTVAAGAPVLGTALDCVLGGLRLAVHFLLLWWLILLSVDWIEKHLDQ